ncbi:hypothetical protein AAFF_G00000040 [Aldrovandia affinis]|uniref:ZZ-type zinc finger-containing protein 3 n=1 Tax=Aldrovandia affinis TaxID=143900 RepID=A0AAD7TCM3_9TELE|nr:hypothetical protein AAFF_G00000040 [Aldrovandia affinis]
MAASRSTRVTRSSVGINGVEDKLYGRTLRNRSITQQEEPPLVSLPRPRSPKKKQNFLHVQQQQQCPPLRGSPLVKQPSGGHEAWMSPRKRSLSCSNKDCPDSPESCAQRVSPLLKHVEHCSHSGDVPGLEGDSPAKPEQTAVDLKEAENDGDYGNLKHARRCLLLDDCGKREVNNMDGLVEEGYPSPIESHNITNGIDTQGAVNAKDSCTDNSINVSCGLLKELCTVPIGGKSKSLLNGTPDIPLDPYVPCRNSYTQQADFEGPPMALERAPSPPLSLAGCASKDLASVRESVEEVHVVKDVVHTSQESSVSSSNRDIRPTLDNSSTNVHMSEAESVSLGPDGSHTASFIEHQEHRYALRTSPCRVVTTAKGLLEEGEGQGVCLKGDKPCCCGQCSEHIKDCSGDGMAQTSVESGLLVSEISKSTKEDCSHNVDENQEDPDVYYFESDHLALKRNKDYQRLLQTIVVLEAQRTQAILDIEALAHHQREALGDPIAFVEQLQKEVKMDLPCPQRVVQLPDIAWDQYTSGLEDFEREFKNKKCNARRLRLIFDKVGLPVRPKSSPYLRNEGESSALYSALPTSDAPEHITSSSQTQMIRGRHCDQSKSHTFNQLWTVDEQKKLEQLLLTFPPEEVESKRWQKIADELGNRTAKQVASRVQKYFIKLTKAGIPVPGRTPNLCMYSKKASSKRQHHLNKHLFRPSTFLTTYEPPVYMDDDDHSSLYSGLLDHTEEDSDDECIPEEFRHLPEYQELQQLKKMKKNKLDENALQQHMGFKCDSCGVEPIQGVRWHCQDCSQDGSVDFCSSCSNRLIKTETHKPDHRLEPICQAETYLDRDYCLPQSAGYNYLDPNYFPANR